MYQRWGAFLGWVSQGLQHEVIAMASCCKKGGGQKGNNCHRQTCTGTTGITVLRRDWVVVAGADLRHAALATITTLPLLYVPTFTASLVASTWVRISLRIHHNGKSTETRVRVACAMGSSSTDMRQCSYLLCPGLFPGVTPYRHDGESLVVPA